MVLLFFIFGCFVSAVWTTKPVQVDVYYESLCPDSQEFITKQLWPTYKKLYNTDVFNVSLYSYGNAFSKYVDGEWNFTCQHGPTECYLNIVQTCATHLNPKPVDYVQFITCMMMHSTEARARICARHYRFDVAAIFKCAHGKLGNTLEYDVGKRTPAHNFIPWIVVNSEDGDEINNKALKDFKGLVCSTYEGEKPEQCLK